MTPRRPPEALRSLVHRDYRLYFAGQLVSMIGTWMQTTAQSWLVYRLTGSGALLGLVAASGQAPSVVLGLFGGAAADRWDRRRLLVVTQTLALVQAAALAWLTSTGRVQVWHVLTLSFLLGVVNVFDMPARQAFVPQLVPRADMSNAIALSGILLNASRLIGPAVAGLIIARAGEAACFWLNAVSYVAVVGSLLAIRPRAAEPRDETESELARIKSGLLYCFEDPERRAILALLAAVSVAATPALMLLPVYSEGVLKAGPRGFGFLMTAFAVGALASSTMLARRASAEELPALVGRSAALFGAAVAGLSLLRGFGAACGAMAVAGWGMMTCFSGGNIRLQDRSSDAMRGRVMGLFSMTFMATGPFGMLAMGWASDRFGAPSALAGGGLACAAAAGLFLTAAGPARRAVLAALATLALAAGASAQERAPVPEIPPPARTLAWDDCVKLALDRSPDLTSALRAADAGRASYYQSYNGLLPSVSLSNSYASGSASAGRAAYSAGATASVSLFDMTKISSVRSASASYERAQADARSASASVRFALRQAFADALNAQTNAEVARRILEIRRVGAEMVSLRYQSGHEYKGNMMNAEAQRLQAEAALAAATRRLRSSRRTFARQLGLDGFDEVTATGTLRAAAPPPPPADARALADARPDVAVAQAAVKSARAASLSAESPLFPSLTATYSRTRGADRTEFPAGPYGWTAGATLSYPLFGGGPTNAYFAVKSSKRSVEKAEADLRAARDAAVADLESAWAAYANAADQVGTQTAQLQASRQRNDEADVRYASGLLSFDNWTVIVSQRVSDEQAAVQSVRDAVVAQAAWEKALGKLLGE